MSHSTDDYEIADIEWRKVTSIAWPTISLIFAIQAILSERPIQIWQINYLAGLVLSLMISWILYRKNRFLFSDTPTILYLVVAPVLVGNHAENAWMSIGLICFAAVIYYSTIRNLTLAIVSISLISIYQTLVARLNLSSISDNVDISYFYSYFSFLWILIMGVSSIFIRRKYLEVAQFIQETVDAEIVLSITRLQGLKQINEKDSRNLRLHGTVLNTLIHIRNMVTQNMPVGSASLTLAKEVKEIAAETITVDEKDFSEKLNEMLNTRTLKRIKVTVNSFPGKFESKVIEESALEIIRELILNAEKHTAATSAALTTERKKGKALRITLVDNSIADLIMQDRLMMLERTKDSRTLKRLLVNCAGTIEVSKTKGGNLRRINIEIPYVDLGLELQSTLARSRISGLNDFALNYVRAGALVTALSLAGYAIVGLNPVALFLTLTMTVGFFLVLRRKPNTIVVAFLVLSSLLIIPSVSLNVRTCAELSPLPWLFNHILTVGFFTSIYFRSRILKWLPIFALTLECLFFPLLYPANCKNIFLGSLPGIPLIIVLALSVLAVRKREFSFDVGESVEAARLARTFTSSDSYRENSFSLLMADLLKYVESIESNPQILENIELISLQIQKIQTFLVCSEHFDSELIRKTYELFTEKQSANIPGRVVLLGENFADSALNHSTKEVIDALRTIKGNGPANLTIVNVHTLEFHFEGGKVVENPSAIAGIPVFYGE